MPTTVNRKRRSSLSMARFVSALGAAAAAIYVSPFFNKTQRHAEAGVGMGKIKRWLRTDSRSQDMLGMRPSAFRALERMLRKAGLADSKYMSAREKLGIFLYMSRYGGTTRLAADTFGRSPNTIARSFAQVLRTLVDPKIYQRWVVMPTKDEPIPERIASDPGISRAFKRVVGAIDGSFLPAFPDATEKARFRTRKGVLAFNILAAVNFEMEFIYILSGWEGPSSDSRLFNEARRAGWGFPSNKKLLADAGFGFSKPLLVPYRGVRYHLKEWGKGSESPQDYKELYNRRHAGARSVVERAFGVIQARFKVLKTGIQFSTEAQAALFPALAVVHNFLRRFDPDDLPEQVEEQPHEVMTEDPALDSKERESAKKYRDRIAMRMYKDWTAYQLSKANQC